jgi:hypothetical protein
MTKTRPVSVAIKLAVTKKNWSPSLRQPKIFNYQTYNDKNVLVVAQNVSIVNHVVTNFFDRHTIGDGMLSIATSLVTKSIMLLIVW